MIRTRHFAAVGSIGLLLLAIVFITMFGSTAIVSRLAALDAERLARGGLASLQSEFDFPGDPVPHRGEYIDGVISHLLADEDERTGKFDVFDPAAFESNQHFGSITGYAVFTKFGQLTIAGGTPIVRKLAYPAMNRAFDAALASSETLVVPLDFMQESGRSIVSVIIPLVRNGTVRGAVSIEIKRHKFEIVMQRGVQLVATVSALITGAAGVFGALALYLWGRAARQAQREAIFLAGTDPVTLLPNRRKFKEILPEEVTKSIASGAEIAVMFSDVDNFKAANDIYGHGAGDRMLVEVGARLKQLLRNGDHLFRVSGDQFAMIIRSPGGVPEISAFCEQMQAAMSAPLLSDDLGVKLSISTGVSRCLIDGFDTEQLMKTADMALSQAKTDGRRTYRLFHPDMNIPVSDFVRLQGALEEALNTDQFHLVYQPQVEVSSGKLVGFEALARWTHPVEGPISPARFIPVAEQSGLIKQLGEWALKQACKDAVMWPDDLSIAVNLSPAQLCDSQLTDLLESVLKQTGLAPKRLELEVTEGVMMQDTELALEAFRAVRALGVGLALDDFGTGYSSLSYLTRIPLTKLKIDKSFIERYGFKKSDDAVVNAVIQLARNLGLKIIAEGVETEAQAMLLAKAGCTIMQGYLYGKPTRKPGAVILAAPLILENGAIRATA